MVDMATETHVTTRFDPFIAALTTAVVSVVLLGLALAYDWLGPDVGEGSAFCEALRGDLVNQPANTFSNLGFVLAGLTIGWRGRKNPQLMDGMVGFFACVVVLLGPASAAMHASGTVLGQNLDLTSMFLISSFAASYAMKRWYELSRTQFFMAFAAWLIMGEAVLFSGIAVPVVLHGGNLVFAIGLLTAIVLEVRLWRRQPSKAVARAGLLTLAVLGGAFTIWLLDQGPWCDPNSLIQGHAVWHFLCAVTTYCQFRMYAADTRKQNSQQPNAPSLN